MRVLVTGAGGFLGRHLVGTLRPDHEVHEFQGDVRDAAAWAAQPRADLVFHLAAQASVPRSVEDPAGTFDVNAGGTLRLLEWARSTRAGRVVVVSTAHVFGKVERSPVDESHPLRPVTPYGASKLAAEALCSAYAATYGLETVVVRPFNVYGPGQAPGYVVPDVLLQLREGKRLRVGDTRPVRDFTYVGDAIDLFVRAGTTPGVGGLAFNLGSGVGHAIAEVIETAIKVSGSALRPDQDAARLRPVELMELVVDARRARERLGWRAATPLEEGLRRTWEAMQKGG